MTTTTTAWSSPSQLDQTPKPECSGASLPQPSQPEALRLWHEGMQLAELCYQATQSFPSQRAYGLDAQIRLTANLIPASVAQGYEQAQQPLAEQHYTSCIKQAKAAVLELKTHLKFSERLSLVPSVVNQMLLEECDMMGRQLQNLCEAA